MFKFTFNNEYTIYAPDLDEALQEVEEWDSIHTMKREPALSPFDVVMVAYSKAVIKSPDLAQRYPLTRSDVGEIGTGGNCVAMGYSCDDYTILVTDFSGVGLPNEGEYMIGFYDEFGAEETFLLMSTEAQQ